MSEIVIFQVDPGVKEFALYQLTLDDGTDLGQVLVARTAHENYAAETEYWSLTQAGMDTIHRANSITWDGASYDWSELPGTSWPGTNPLALFSMPAVVTWSAVNPPRSVFATNDSSNNVTLNFGLVYEDGRWSGTLDWAQTGSATFVIPVGQTTMTMTEVPDGSSWTGATVRPEPTTFEAA